MTPSIQSAVQTVSHEAANQQLELKWGRSAAGFLASTVLVCALLGLLHGI